METDDLAIGAPDPREDLLALDTALSLRWSITLRASSIVLISAVWYSTRPSSRAILAYAFPRGIFPFCQMNPVDVLAGVLQLLSGDVPERACPVVRLVRAHAASPQVFLLSRMRLGLVGSPSKPKRINPLKLCQRIVFAISIESCR